MNDRLWSDFSWRQTSMPSIFGIMTSSRMRSGRSCPRERQGFFAVRGLQQLIALRREPRHQDVAIGLDIVDDEDPRGIVHDESRGAS